MKFHSTRDGLNRTGYIEKTAHLNNFPALESDWMKLFHWLMKAAGSIRYYNADNVPSGTFDGLWQNQLLYVLVEICLFEIQELEKDLLRNKGTALQERIIDDCNQFATTCIAQLRTFSAENPGSLSVIADELRTKLERSRHLNSQENENDDFEKAQDVTKLFYSLQTCFNEIRNKQDYYLERIKETGQTDPSLALLIVFLQNYGNVTGMFNENFRQLPAFYLNRILQSQPRPVQPDRTRLAFTLLPNVNETMIPANTRFIAGKTAEGANLYYRIPHDFLINPLRIAEIYSLFLEEKKHCIPFLLPKDETIVTSVRSKRIPVQFPVFPHPFFPETEEETSPAEIGWILESPMFLMREGNREISLHFTLTDSSASYIDDFIRTGCGITAPDDPLVSQIFEDAFQIRVSQETGWEHVPTGKTAYLSDEKNIVLSVGLPEESPATAACKEESHHLHTDFPALHITFNPGAWFFPYSWATQIIPEKLTIYSEAKGITGLSLYNETGRIDPAAPFFPFGMQPQKGAWLAFSNYEMAIKPLEEVILSWTWEQLPGHEQGLKGHYSLYTPNIDNNSFQAEPQFLKEKCWTPLPETPLFKAPSPDSRPEKESRVVYSLPSPSPAVIVPEEKFTHESRYAVFRLVLSRPEMGFGHALYRRLFADVMAHNSRKKETVPLPEEPVSPLMNELQISYKAQYQSSWETLNGKNATRLRRISPFPGIQSQSGHTLVSPLTHGGNLVIGLQNALGMNHIRLFFHIIPQKEETYRPEKSGHTPPQLYAQYRIAGEEIIIPNDCILEESTCCLSTSGIVEIRLPEPIRDEQTDKRGLFWLTLSIGGDYHFCQLLRGVYLHTAEVTAEGGNGLSLPEGTITESTLSLPAIQTIRQILPGYGGCPAETTDGQGIRISHRIAHRNRTVLPSDYEAFVMEQFPEIEKVKCIPATGYQEKTVTVVAMMRQPGEPYPLCTPELLQDIRHRLSPLMPPGARLQVLNPIYEPLAIRCHILLHKDVSASDMLYRIRKKINNYIAPWLVEQQMPPMNENFSLKGLYLILMNDEYIAELTRLSVQLAGRPTDYQPDDFSIDRYEDPEIPVPRSCPWSIFIPAENHLIEYDHHSNDAPESGIGENFTV